MYCGSRDDSHKPNQTWGEHGTCVQLDALRQDLEHQGRCKDKGKLEVNMMEAMVAATNSVLDSSCHETCAFCFLDFQSLFGLGNPKHNLSASCVFYEPSGNSDFSNSLCGQYVGNGGL